MAKTKRPSYAVGSPYAMRRLTVGRVPRPRISFVRSFRGAASRARDEMKFFDTALSFSFDSTGEVPTTGQLVLIPQGVQESQRVGRKAFIHSIQIQAMLHFLPGTAIDTGITYLYLVLDKQANKLAAGVTDVVTTTVFGSAQRNLNNDQRFVVLKRWVHTWVSQNGVNAAAGDVSKNLSFYKKLPGIQIDYNSTAGAITEITSNNLFLMAGSSIQDDTVSLLGSCRVRYTD